ncbi:Hypothetical_protein [Hexamita inflata]|uniref:Hypothetical_protein n=1 Tax=Hexamita inflata TaxID=28002 RepID=A0AA86RKB4_9EUKA|nr:Hypothetical protein HINF_LOCUS62858 [Hexamita inflata]
MKLSVVRTFLQAGASVGEGVVREERAGAFASLVAGVVGLGAREVGWAAYVGRAEEASVGVSVVAGVGAGVAALVRAFVQEDLGGLGVAVLHTVLSETKTGLAPSQASWQRRSLVNLVELKRLQTASHLSMETWKAESRPWTSASQFGRQVWKPVAAMTLQKG